PRLAPSLGADTFFSFSITSESTTPRSRILPINSISSGEENRSLTNLTRSSIFISPQSIRRPWTTIIRFFRRSDSLTRSEYAASVSSTTISYNCILVLRSTIGFPRWPRLAAAVSAVVGALVVLVLAYWMFQFVVESTYLGVRFTNATQLEDGSSQTRLELFLTGLRVFAQNPIFGTGLGQFGVVSRTGHYAHNEFAEIIATTGLPGFLMYFSIYLLVWRRLTGCLRRVADPLIGYRINMARLIVLILVLSGFLSRPNFIAQDTMFLLGLVVGVSHWAERTVRLAAGQGAAAVAPAWAATGWEAPGWGPPAPAGWGAGLSGSPMVPAASGLPAFNRRT
ncbi:MAG: O-antigen ligase family protein, partial [Opitutae bacterium]|nr:O-antigen ligase family protein [Opitutae bacterium]